MCLGTAMSRSSYAVLVLLLCAVCLVSVTPVVATKRAPKSTSYMNPGEFTYNAGSPKPLYLRVRVMGGGGGGGAANLGYDYGAASGSGGALSSFDNLIAGGGQGGTYNEFSSMGGQGGGTNTNAFSGGSHTDFVGSAGQGGAFVSLGNLYEKDVVNGGIGGSSVMSGGATPSDSGPNSGGLYGAGGAGGSFQAREYNGEPQTYSQSGSGGGAGAYIEALISPVASSYKVVVGQGGAAGIVAYQESNGVRALDDSGTAGGNGFVIVEAFYQ